MSRPHPPWDPLAEDRFVCTALRSVGPDVATVVLAPSRAATVHFDAGQYVTIEFDVAGEAVQRTYTIASPPTRPERLAITVKRIGAGRVSSWLHDGGLRVGTVVRVSPPQGEFTRAAHPAASYLLLTAGTGITPALSMLREDDDLGEDGDVVLVHSQSRAADVPYADELAAIAGRLPGLRLRVLAREPGAGPFPAGTVSAGRLDADRLAELVPDVTDREVLVCGPDSYRTAARAALLSLGCREDRIHEESFVFASGSPAESLAESPAESPESDQFRVEFRDHGVVVGCSPDGTLLGAAAAAGLRLPSSCAQGLCGTCKSTLVTGEVDMQHAGGIRPREIAAGKVLLCCSRPLSDVVITG